MPIDSPKAKLDGTAFWGASIVKYDRQNEDREKIGRDLATKLNAAIIPPLIMLMSLMAKAQVE